MQEAEKLTIAHHRAFRGLRKPRTTKDSVVPLDRLPIFIIQVERFFYWHISSTRAYVPLGRQF